MKWIIDLFSHQPVSRDHAVNVRRLERDDDVRKTEVLEDADVSDDAPPADEQLVLAERQRLLRAALATLDDDRRAVFVLFELDGESMPSIAETLGIPLNTAYSRLRLARDDMRAAVQRLARSDRAPAPIRTSTASAPERRDR